MIAAPRIEIDLDKLHFNALELVARLHEHSIAVTGVTKAALGSIEVASTLLRAGVSGLGDSRIKNIRAMRLSDRDGRLNKAVMMLIRSPMLSEVELVVMYADISCNTEIEVIEALSLEAVKQDRVHQVILMVELGDLREGIMPDDLLPTVARVIGLPNIMLKGIGTNLACRSGVSPDTANMAELSDLADVVETTFELSLDIVSGGNSANLQWALNNDDNQAGRINNLRIGEAILLGCETLHRQPIDGLHTDVFTLVAEVIESKQKPSLPRGEIAQAAFGEVEPVVDRGLVREVILAVGIQDTDPEGLQAPGGLRITGASSDHLVMESDNNDVNVGQEVAFQMNYSALLRAMTSPYVAKKYKLNDEVCSVNIFG